MAPRRLWLLVFALPIALAAAAFSRAIPPLLVLTALVAALASPIPRVGTPMASGLAAAAWMTAVGPWSGISRYVAGAIAGVVCAVSVTGLRHRSRAGAMAAAVVVLASVLAVRTPPTVGPAAASARLEAVDSYLRREVEQAQIPGVAAAVVENGHVVFSRGYGQASRNTPMTPDTPVVIGSTSKSITALATLQLVEEGSVELDAPIGRYLPWFEPADERAEAITVRQLLIDTSGIPTWAGWSALAGNGRANKASMRRLLNSVRLAGEPGGRFRYSNANYIVLGEIIESVTQRPYAAVVNESIFGPLGMLHTTAGPAPGTTANRYWLGIPLESHLPYLEIGLPAGAISSTAAGLARYLQAHLGQPRPGVLSKTTRELLHKPAVKAEGFGVPAGRHYAMGWYVGTVAGEPAVFHSGDVFDSAPPW